MLRALVAADPEPAQGYVPAFVGAPCAFTSRAGGLRVIEPRQSRLHEQDIVARPSERVPQLSRSCVGCHLVWMMRCRVLLARVYDLTCPTTREDRNDRRFIRDPRP